MTSDALPWIATVCVSLGATGLMYRTWPADGARSKQRCQKSIEREGCLQPGSVLHQTDEKTTWRQHDERASGTGVKLLMLKTWCGIEARQRVTMWHAAVQKSVEYFAESAPNFWIEVHLVYPYTHTHLYTSTIVLLFMLHWLTKNDYNLLVVLFPTLNNNFHSLIESDSTWFSLRFGCIFMIVSIC